MWRSVQCYLCIYVSYLSMQNDLSSNLCIFKSYLLYCCGLSPPRTCWSECSAGTWLICWNWNQESFLPSIPAQLLKEFSVAPATEQCLNQTKLMVGIYQNREFFPEVRHKMTFILSHPSSSFNRGEMFYHRLFRSNSVTFCLSASYSMTCH